MGDDPNGPNGPDREHQTLPNNQDPTRSGELGDIRPADPSDDMTDELERQAREALRLFRESAGELGTRVRDVLDRASSYWQEAGPEPPAVGAVPSADDMRARELARRWSAVDFLVDPELPEMMTVRSVRATAIWQIELRERGETRFLSEGFEPYNGEVMGVPGPVLPVWEYAFPSSPDIQAGERRERVRGTETLAACHSCNGTGHRACASCSGKGFVQCPACHGRSRLPCPRCRGRGEIADPVAERRARSHKGYLQVQAERFATDASSRIADFAEKLRQDYGVPLPPSATWAPTAPASGETIPCPDCVDGTIPCTCRSGKRICDSCGGTGAAVCTSCAGTGRNVRYREVVRRFDTRISERMLPLEDPAEAAWLTDEMVRRARGEPVWAGDPATVSAATPLGVPARVWTAALDFVRGNGHALPAPPTGASGGGRGPTEDSRRVTLRRVYLTRIPVVRVDYSFSGKAFAFVAVGASGSERFWSQDFPPRWSRVGRFFKAVSRDLGLDASEPQHTRVTPSAGLTNLDEFRLRRDRAQALQSPPVTSGEDQSSNGNGATLPASNPPMPPAPPTQHADGED